MTTTSTTTQNRRRRSAWRPAVLAAIGGAVLLAMGVGVWATLTATAFNTTPQSIDTGTLRLTMANNGAGFGQTITNMAPGDTVNRYVTLTNGGTLAAQALTMQIAATGDAALITDGVAPVATKALTVRVTNCVGGTWTPTTGVCSGTTASVLTATTLGSLSTPVTLIPGSIAAGATQQLQISVVLPDQNETTVNGALPANTVQGKSVQLTYTFSETQRGATTTNS